MAAALCSFSSPLSPSLLTISALPSVFLSATKSSLSQNPSSSSNLIFFTKRKLVRRRRRRRRRIRATIREWKEYEEAVKEKDLARALNFLRSIENLPIQQSSSIPSLGGVSVDEGLSFLRPERNWEVLDACINADDMKLVGSAYRFLQERGFLPNFGKCRNLVLEGPRDVTPAVLKSSTGLEAIKLSPKKWGLSGTSGAVFVAFLGGASFLLSQGIDIRPNLTAILGLAMLDSIFLGGCCLAQISSYWPPYRRRILVHEAGHLLTAYLMGCPIRGVILDPIVAMQMGIQGQVLPSSPHFLKRGLSFGMRSWRKSLVKADSARLLLIGTAWYFLLELQLKLLFMEKQKVEKMMRICSGASVFFCNPLYQLHKSASDLLHFYMKILVSCGAKDTTHPAVDVAYFHWWLIYFFLWFLLGFGLFFAANNNLPRQPAGRKCQIRQGGQFCNPITFSNGIKVLIELLLKLLKAAAILVLSSGVLRKQSF